MKRFCDECKGELKFFKSYAYCENCGIEIPYEDDDYDKYLKAYPIVRKKHTTEEAIQEAEGQIEDRQKELAVRLSKGVLGVFAAVIAVFLFAGIKVMGLGYEYTVLGFGILGLDIAVIGGLFYYLFYYFNNRRKARKEIKRLKKRIAAESAVLEEIESVPGFDEFLRGQEL